MSLADHSLNEHMEAQAREALKSLTAAWRHARRRQGHVDSVHDLRVSIRRFMQCLGAFDHLFHPGHVQKMRHRLHKVMALCGSVRDFQVALELLESPGMPKVCAFLRKHLMHGRSQGWKKLKQQLEQKRKSPSKKHWRGFLTPTESNDGVHNVPGTVAQNAIRVLPPMAGEFFAAGAAAVVSGVAYSKIHNFRLLTKRFRYTLDLFPSLYGEDGKQGLEALRELQDCLGAVNDCVASRRLLAGRPSTVQLRAARARIRTLLAERKAAFYTCWEVHFARRKSLWFEWLALPETTMARLATRGK